LLKAGYGTLSYVRKDNSIEHYNVLY
jgi:hypothetical protein